MHSQLHFVLLDLTESHIISLHEDGKEQANFGFGGWKNFYDLYYLKHGGVVHGKLEVYENVGVLSTGGPCVRYLKTPSPLHTTPCVKHIKHGLGI